MSEEQMNTEELEETLQEAADEAPVEETVVEEVFEPEVESEPEVEPEPEPEPVVAPAPEAPARQLSQKVWIAISCAALVLGLLIGKFALGGAGASAAAGSFAGKTAISESELDLPMATLTYAGTTEGITAREIIMANGSLETAMNEEGNYYLPSADAVLSTARNRVIDHEAASRGITVSDEDLAAFAEQNLGSSDYASIAQSYGMDEQSVIDVLRSSATMQKLRAEVVGTTSTAVMPEAPAELAEDADASEPTAEYANYIISLVGDEWDAAKGDWAAPTGPYATALANYEITADGATYEAAQVAYYVAYQKYSEEDSSTSRAWTDYVNGLLANAQIEISTLVA